MCCTRLSGNTGRKNSHQRPIAELCRAISSQLRHASTIGKNLLNSKTFFTCPHNIAYFGPLAAEIGSGVWGTPGNFNGFRVLASLLVSFTGGQLKFARYLAASWAATLSYILGGCCRLTEFRHVKNLLCVQVSRSPILAALLHGTPSAGQPNFAAWYKEWNYGTFAQGATIFG